MFPLPLLRARVLGLTSRLRRTISTPASSLSSDRAAWTLLLYLGMEIGHMKPQPGGKLTWFNAVLKHDDKVKYKLSCVWNEAVPDCRENAALQAMLGTTDSRSNCKIGRKLIRDNVSL